jgi:hypothetical protein
LSERVKELQDGDLEDRVRHAGHAAGETVEKKIWEVMDEHAARIEEIREETREMVSRYQRYYEILGEKIAQKYERLSQRYERHMEELRSEYEDIEQQIIEEINSLEVELPPLPEAENGLPARDWLYDSCRDFLDQTDRLRDSKL